MTKFAVAFGKRMREARRAAGLTQQEAADAVGIEPLGWGRAERGEFLPRADRLPAVARTLAVSTDWLLGMEERMPKGASLTPEARRLAERLSRLDPRAVTVLAHLVDIMVPEKRG